MKTNLRISCRSPFPFVACVGASGSSVPPWPQFPKGPLNPYNFSCHAVFWVLRQRKALEIQVRRFLVAVTLESSCRQSVSVINHLPSLALRLDSSSSLHLHLLLLRYFPFVVSELLECLVSELRVSLISRT